MGGFAPGTPAGQALRSLLQGGTREGTTAAVRAPAGGAASAVQPNPKIQGLLGAGGKVGQRPGDVRHPMQTPPGMSPIVSPLGFRGRPTTQGTIGSSLHRQEPEEY